MQILLVGVNHRTAPLELRERLAFTSEEAQRASAELRSRASFVEGVVLSTCNRSELYGVAGSDLRNAASLLESCFASFHSVDAAEAAPHLYRLQDVDAVRHLFRVASGLDSMLLGEAEILGQVRDAYRRALESGTTGPVLNRLFQSALEVGKRVRSETDLGTRPMSVAFAAVKLAEQIFGKLRGHGALALGAGTVSEQVVGHLRDRGIERMLVCNRTRAHGEELARLVKGEVVGWEALEEALATPEILVSSVSSTDPVVTRAMIERAMHARGNRAMFIIDLGVPRNIEPGVADLYNVYLYNHEDLSHIVEQNRKAREGEIPRAEALVTEQVGKFEMWHAAVQVMALLKELRLKLQSEREEFLHQRREEIGRLSPEERRRFGFLAEDLIEHVLRGTEERWRVPADTRFGTQEVAAVRRFFGLAGEEP